MSELDHSFAPFKTGSKASLAERARQLGLEATAMEIIEGSRAGWDLNTLVDSRVEGRSSCAEVETGLVHIIADVIMHDKATCDFVRDIGRRARIELQVKKAAAAAVKTKKEPSATKATAAKATAPKATTKAAGKTEDEAKKFENYFNFSCPVPFVKPHQVLAINRGENLKVPTSYIF
jgi:transcriptional accessory protein Tex/SPT6